MIGRQIYSVIILAKHSFEADVEERPVSPSEINLRRIHIISETIFTSTFFLYLI